MISFVRELAALPLKLVFFLCNLLRIPRRAALAAAIWKVSGEIYWANIWIVCVLNERGANAARQLAEDLLTRRKDARIACQMGTIEYSGFKNPAAAEAWIHRAEAIQCSNQEELLHLKLELSDHLATYRAQDIIDQILSRKDLSMDYSRAARIVQTELWIRRQDWQKADGLLDEMLHIESEPVIHMYKWMTAAALGRDTQATENFQLARNKLQGHQVSFYQTLGLFYLGRMDEARQMLAKTVEQGMDIRNILLAAPAMSVLLPQAQMPPQEGDDR